MSSNFQKHIFSVCGVSFLFGYIYPCFSSKSTPDDIQRQLQNTSTIPLYGPGATTTASGFSPVSNIQVCDSQGIVYRSIHADAAGMSDNIVLTALKIETF